MSADTDTVWIPAVPLPFFGWRRVRCTCGETFKGRDREHAYEIHYRRAHQRGDRNPSAPDDGCSMSITRAEARALYAEVNADTDSPPENVQLPVCCRRRTHDRRKELLMSVSDGRAQTETSETIEQLKERTHDIVPHFQTGSWTLATNWRDPHGPDCPACFADSLLGRLTTAETEREGYKSAEQSWMATAQLNERRFRAAEARVEAAEQALRDIIAADSAPFRTAEGMAAWTDSIARDYFARAALACPPQQPQKAGE